MPSKTTRTDIVFSSGADECAGWLYTPDRSATDGPAPIIVMAHGLGGVKEERLDAFAERFTAQGYACLVFDYRYFGASGGQPRQLLDVKAQLADWKAAVGLSTMDRRWRAVAGTLLLPMAQNAGLRAPSRAPALSNS